MYMKIKYKAARNIDYYYIILPHTRLLWMHFKFQLGLPKIVHIMCTKWYIAVYILQHIVYNYCAIQQIFRGKDANLLFHQLSLFFTSVTCAKPRSSRNSSIEAFVVCQCYTPPPHYIPVMSNPLLGRAMDDTSSQGGIVPFVVCGDLSQYDSDMTYPVKVNLYVLYVYVPISPGGV